MKDHRSHVAKSFGRVLRDARDRCGISQEELAKRAKLDRTYPSLLERGLRSPSVDTVVSMAPILGLSPQSLFARFMRDLVAPQA